MCARERVELNVQGSAAVLATLVVRETRWREMDDGGKPRHPEKARRTKDAQTP